MGINLNELEELLLAAVGKSEWDSPTSVRTNCRYITSDVRVQRGDGQTEAPVFTLGAGLVDDVDNVSITVAGAVVSRMLRIVSTLPNAAVVMREPFSLKDRMLEGKFSVYEV